MVPDKEALRILFETFWSPQGWKQERYTSPSDFEYAKSKGVMFDETTCTHDKAIELAVEFREMISKSIVSEAFVSSLRSRRLDLRSALGSYAVVQHLHNHNHLDNGEKICRICGQYSGRHRIDRNVYNFERFKWGGVRHLDPAYAGTDLALFIETDFDQPHRDDYLILENILDVANSMPAKSTLADLDKSLGSIFVSNSAERRTLIEILGYCGILTDPFRNNFRTSFVNYSDRDHPGGKNDWNFPVVWWRSQFGVDQVAVQDWFPQIYLRQKKNIN